MSDGRRSGLRSCNPWGRWALGALSARRAHRATRSHPTVPTLTALCCDPAGVIPTVLQPPHSSRSHRPTASLMTTKPTYSRAEIKQREEQLTKCFQACDFVRPTNTAAYSDTQKAATAWQFRSSCDAHCGSL